MKQITKFALVGALTLGGANIAYANCAAENGKVSIVGNEFPALQSVAAKVETCAHDGLEIEVNLTADHQKINLAGLQADPAAYSTAIVANSSLVPLMVDGVVRPLNDLIDEYGGVNDRQKIVVGGDVMAIAFMANAQHLMYRGDILSEAGVEAPTSYEELLAAAEAIKSAGLIEYPVIGTYKAGWNLAQEFTNMYLGYGGEFYEPGTANVAINNDQGVATLEMMKSLTAYMNPDYLTYDSNAVSAEWEAGNAALTNFWGSRAEGLVDDEGSTPEVAGNTLVAGPLMVGDSGVPATTLWWDGFTVATNISDEDAAATFQAMTFGISPSLLTDENQGQAVWIIEGYQPAPYNEGVIATIDAKAKPYPMLPYHGILHTAIGDNISDYLQGNESAEEALADIEAAYNAAASEAGFL